MNRNQTIVTDTRYVRQQQAIQKVCAELNLVPFYPSYHAEGTDCNTVILYTREGHQANKKLSVWAPVDEEQGRVCALENTNINGMFDLGWMNYGKLDLRGFDEIEKIETLVRECLRNIKSEGEEGENG